MIKKILLMYLLIFLSIFTKEISKKDIKSIYISPYSFSVTVKRMEDELKKMEIPIFAKFDHSLNAKEVDLNLNETMVIVFGSPKVGTLLMQKKPEIAIELPLKVLISTNKYNQTEIRFQDIEKIAKNYNLENDEIILKMEFFLNDLVEKVVIKDSSELYKRRNFNDFSFLNNEQGRLNEENSNNVSCFYNRHFYI